MISKNANHKVVLLGRLSPPSDRTRTNTTAKKKYNFHRLEIISQTDKCLSHLNLWLIILLDLQVKYEWAQHYCHKNWTRRMTEKEQSKVQRHRKIDFYLCIHPYSWSSTTDSYVSGRKPLQDRLRMAKKRYLKLGRTFFLEPAMIFKPSWLNAAHVIGNPLKTTSCRKCSSDSARPTLTTTIPAVTLQVMIILGVPHNKRSQCCSFCANHYTKYYIVPCLPHRRPMTRVNLFSQAKM